jgi:hypothetical protein
MVCASQALPAAPAWATASLPAAQAPMGQPRARAITASGCRGGA